MNTTSTKTIRPASSIIHRKDGYLIECDMPGVARDGINITVENNILTIQGRRAPRVAGVVLHAETAQFDYKRAFALESDFDITKTSAQLTDGVLRILLPFAETQKPRKVTVV